MNIELRLVWLKCETILVTLYISLGYEMTMRLTNIIPQCHKVYLLQEKSQFTYDTI